MVLRRLTTSEMAWNAFKFCSALRAFGSIMIVLVVGILCLTYYAVVFATYGPALFRGGLDSLTSLFVLLTFHPLVGMVLWSYFSVILTDPGGVPSNWRPPTDEERGDWDPFIGSEAHQSTVHGDQPNQKVRYCQKCKHYKPPRSHHCSVCGRCILRMDHHCVWVVNCVGVSNYKYFVLFLFYTFLATAHVTLSLVPVFIKFFGDGELPGDPGMLAASFVTFILNAAFSLSLLGFLILHLSLVTSNTTTIEAFEKKTTPKWQYDLGRKKNFEQVFGMDKRYWFIPAYSEEDLRRIVALRGLEYPTNPELRALQPI